jgi:hypothetical protein
VNLIGAIIPHIGLPKWLAHPVGYLLDQIRDLFVDIYNSAATTFQQLILHVYNPIQGSWQDELYGNAWGLALKFGGSVLLFTAMAAMVLPKKWSERVLRSGIAVALLAFAPEFYRVSQSLNDVSERLSSAVIFHHPAGSQGNELLFLPQVHNVILAIFATALISIGAGLLILVFVAYVIINVLATFFLVPLFEIRPLGAFPERLFGWLASLGFIAVVLGRPLAVLELNVGRAINDGLPQNTPAIIPVVVLLIILAFAIYTQFLLVDGAHKVYSKATGGNVRSDATVTGKVNATIKENVKVVVSRITSDHIKEADHSFVPNSLGRLRTTSTISRSRVTDEFKDRV